MGVRRAEKVKELRSGTCWPHHSHHIQFCACPLSSRRETTVPRCGVGRKLSKQQQGRWPSKSSPQIKASYNRRRIQYDTTRGEALAPQLFINARSHSREKGHLASCTSLCMLSARLPLDGFPLKFGTGNVCENLQQKSERG